MTIGDISTMNYEVDNEVVELEILDTGGIDEYMKIASQKVKATDAFMLVFDLSNEESFNNI